MGIYLMQLFFNTSSCINSLINRYIGIGLSADEVDTNALPGWRENSFGYHGDDGKSFCSSGTGQPYGPTFTTNDVIGCGINFIDNTCFYTKNGLNLGTAFDDLPLNLYPTIGLNSHGEIVEANFGQSPFVYKIEDDMRELRARIASVILNYPIPDKPMEASIQRYHNISRFLNITSKKMNPFVFAV